MLESFIVIFNTLAWLAGLVLVSSKLWRSVPKLPVRQLIMGLIFGLAATVMMLGPLHLLPGVQIDGRNIFIGLAGAFSGPIGATVALLVTASVRLSLGGIGVVSAMSSMAFCAIAGLVWAELEKRKMIKSPWRWPALAGMISASIPLLLVLPSSADMEAFVQGGPLLLLIYTGGVVVFGPLLASEIKFDEDNRDLRHLSLTDPLTGALNRRGLQLNFDKMVRRKPTRDSYQGVTMIMIDFDHFKEMNDSYGHDAGDLALKTLVETVISNVRSDDLVARLGGDEFAVCVCGVTRARAEQIAKHLHEQLRLRLSLPGVPEPVEIIVSIGAVYTSEPQPNMVDLVTCADRNLMSAKQSGRDRYIFEAINTFPRLQRGCPDGC